MKNNKTFAFDLGGVLFGFDYTIALSKIENKMEASIDEVIDRLYLKDFGLNFEKGLLSSEQFYLNFKEAFGATLNFDEFVDAWCDIFYPQVQVIDLVRNLKGKYPIYLISNINQLHFEFLYNRFAQVFDVFDGLILSFKVKSVKPEFEIYKALKDKAGADFEDIIYIDDRKDLIDAAKNFNLQCIQFSSHTQLLNDLKGLGVLPA